MIKAVTTFVFGVLLAVLIIATALAAAVWVIGMAGKAALFGDPKSSLAMKVFERMYERSKTDRTDITHITPTNNQASEGS